MQKPQTYTKRVEAMQFDGTGPNFGAISVWLREHGVDCELNDSRVVTAQGEICPAGDWLASSAPGHFYRVEDRLFHAEYAAVNVARAIDPEHFKCESCGGQTPAAQMTGLRHRDGWLLPHWCADCRAQAIAGWTTLPVPVPESAALPHPPWLTVVRDVGEC